MPSLTAMETLASASFNTSRRLFTVVSIIAAVISRSPEANTHGVFAFANLNAHTFKAGVGLIFENGLSP